MNSDDLDQALARVDAALARLAFAVSRPQHTDDDLAIRHEQLRTAIARTLGQLDALIAEQSA